jgi:hypothetical protein
MPPPNQIHSWGAHFVDNAGRKAASSLEVNGYEPLADSKMSTRDETLRAIVNQFVADATAAGLRVRRQDAHRFLASLVSKRFLIATGLAGSGKTKLAQAFARWISPKTIATDPFQAGAQVPSERVTYLVKRSDRLAVEFWNTPDGAIRVTLPREMIVEWADHILRNKLPRDVPARDIREAVKTESRFSDQLHSFETHLKAAAFALIDAGSSQAEFTSYEIVPVGADWTGNEHILGYPSGLDPQTYVTKPTLNLLLRAAERPDVPHLLVLDEMNLSHVERYFPDVLSAIESGEPIPLHEHGDRKAGNLTVPSRITIPENLFLVGTVNVDETTYMFSPKVLDRANVMEFRMEAEELAAFLGNPASPSLAILDGKGAGFGAALVNAAHETADVPREIMRRFQDEMALFFGVLQDHGAEFGYRVAHEAVRFLSAYYAMSETPVDNPDAMRQAFDCVVCQKFLPKLHGSRTKLAPLLKKLWYLCVNDHADRGADPHSSADVAMRSTEPRHEPSAGNARQAGVPYPISAEKIARMWRQLNENGFASFAEA